MAQTVKAYMSDRAYRERWARVNRTHGVTAVREARRILAETEHQSDPSIIRMLGPGHWSAYEIGEQYPNTSPCADFGSALAEALAAFVADDAE